MNKPARSAKRPMRERIVEATVGVLRERGFAGTTTKEVARAAGVAEGSIYNHFGNKTELIAAAMGMVAGGIRDAMMRLAGNVGRRTVEENLTEMAEAQIAFLLDLLPITGPVMGDRDTREWLRQGGPRRHVPGEATGPPQGPVLGHAGLIGYLEAEQRAGRLSADADPAYLAAALLGTCLQFAFLTLFTEPQVIAEVARLPADPAAYARRAVRTVLAGHA